MREGHPVSSKDPLNATELARTVALGARIVRLERLGKNRQAARLRKIVDGIRTHATERETYRESERNRQAAERRRARW